MYVHVRYFAVAIRICRRDERFGHSLERLGIVFLVARVIVVVARVMVVAARVVVVGAGFAAFATDHLKCRFGTEVVAAELVRAPTRQVRAWNPSSSRSCWHSPPLGPAAASSPGPPRRWVRQRCPGLEEPRKGIRRRRRVRPYTQGR